MKKSTEMNTDELCRWFAFANAVKFTYLHDVQMFKRRKTKKVKQSDLPWLKTTEYIDEVSGDFEKCLKEKGGIPLKYSLNLAEDDAKVASEIEYN